MNEETKGTVTKGTVVIGKNSEEMSHSAGLGEKKVIINGDEFLKRVDDGTIVVNDKTVNIIESIIDGIDAEMRQATSGMWTMFFNGVFACIPLFAAMNFGANPTFAAVCSTIIIGFGKLNVIFKRRFTAKSITIELYHGKTTEDTTSPNGTELQS